MMLFLASLLLPLAMLPNIASSAPALTAKPITYFVREFSAFVATKPDDNSTASFRFSDPRDKFKLDITCKFEAQSPYPEDFVPCGSDDSATWFKLTEGDLTIIRAWDIDTDYVYTEAPQGTYWNSGEGGNVTTTQDGTLYTRTTDWEFPVQSMWVTGEW